VVHGGAPRARMLAAEDAEKERGEGEGRSKSLYRDERASPALVLALFLKRAGGCATAASLQLGARRGNARLSRRVT